jgi:hypothetical protein
VNDAPVQPVSVDVQELTCVPEQDVDLNDIILLLHDVNPDAAGITLPDVATVDGVNVNKTFPEHVAAALIVSENVAVRVKEPDVPVIVTVCVPVGVEDVVAIVTVDVHVEVHVPGVNVQETPAGPVHVSVTVPEPVTVTVAVVVVDEPCVTVPLVGFNVNEKSNAGGAAPEFRNHRFVFASFLKKVISRLAAFVSPASLGWLLSVS